MSKEYQLDKESLSNSERFKKEHERAKAEEILKKAVIRYKERFIDIQKLPDFLFSTYFAVQLEDLAEPLLRGR